MEDLQEADVLWPETPPLPVLVLHGAATVFDFGSFGARDSSSPRPTSTELLLGRRSDGFVSDAYTVAGGLDDGGVQAEEFQEADVLWPDDVDADTARDQFDDNVGEGEFWWLSRDFRDAGSHVEEEEEEKAAAADPAGNEVWKHLVSSPIDIPTRVAAARRYTTAMSMHRRRR
ncbi:hypothetical protein GUJ93_ZPchr0010g11107 [Zizania palustris]|uniref:Uncharacterized protein n=1 Tax=Zizania palustris TaxID=103762 RepID=A0A8J5WDL6_ZIZPA|nr:hypothetical protein GUJ93_ZPchr0010g11107 [Zizania palustris]